MNNKKIENKKLNKMKIMVEDFQMKFKQLKNNINGL